MNHSFNTDIATALGLPCAVILEHIWFWTFKNEANGKHFHDGLYWTYNSVKAFSELFPYLTAKQIRTALEKLRAEGLVETGNFNENAYDRTLWYALTEKGKTLCRTGQIHLPDGANPFALQGEPIPDIKPDVIPDMKREEDKSSSSAERSDDPSTQEVKSPIVFKLETNDGAFYEVTQAEVDKYIALYPAVDIEQEYRKMIGWIDGNKRYRKTLRGMPRFINGWLARAQDHAKGGVRNAANRRGPDEGPRRVGGETIL